MIRIKGNLELVSKNSRIRLYDEDGATICAIQGWPHPLSPWSYNRIGFPKEIQHLPVKILYNGRALGKLQNGRLRISSWYAAIIALFDYLVK